MAPEAILGEGVDRRADVYALGCLMYFLLTGKILFEADTSMRLLLKHVQEIPLPPSRRTEQSIPRDIDEVVMACVHKDPNRRPRDAGELLHLISDSRITGDWDHRAAQSWWESHLPQFTMPSSLALHQWGVSGQALTVE
jgi:serine/threonine protein kinase